MRRLLLTVLLASSAVADIQDPLHPRPHQVADDPSRFHTNRDGAALELPVEEEAFVFAVFGDRTGGPAAGISVLRDAVADVNLVEPDFVMTVGDLINGYNETPEWLKQMEEYKTTMDALLVPWFPVAGNHDVYWRGEGDRPAGEHEQEYEFHFGPLWYAFEHKESMFIVLYTDEGHPETGAKSFGEPAAQRMSKEQFKWLRTMLHRGRGARHIFVFLHHPRWLEGNYGDDWNRVHKSLANAGNVRVVFAGHIHRMRYDGPRDGIEYVTLATVGGGQSEAVPEAGYLHHYDLVTVRDDQIALSSYPVGEVMDVRAITGDISNETRELSALEPSVSGPVHFNEDRSVHDVVEITLRNPTTTPIEVDLAPRSGDSRWRFIPNHAHSRINPGESKTFKFTFARDAAPMDSSFRPPEIQVGMDYLATGRRYSIPRKAILLEVVAPGVPSPVPAP